MSDSRSPAPSDSPERRNRTPGTGDAADRVAARLAGSLSSHCHVGAVVCAVDAGRLEPQAGAQRAPAHWLAAAWAPAQHGPLRWPAAVALGSPDAHNALLELLERLPPQARLHLAPIEELDMGLAARIVLHCDRNLEPYQREGLARFIDRWHAHELEAIRTRYTDRDEGFDRFIGRLAEPGAD
jgi:hypothetical protein